MPDPYATVAPHAPARPVKILHLEDSLIDHQLVQRALKQAGLNFTMQHVDTLPAFVQAVQAGDLDVILADYRLSDFTAMDAWANLSSLARHPPFILLSGTIGEAAAVDAIKLGMSDYLLKGNLPKLAHIIARAIEAQEVQLARDQANADLAASEQRLAAFAEHLQTTIEQERAAIAREIHDDIGGSLAAIQFDLAWVARHTRDAATLQHVGNATDMLRHAIGASQRIMMDLRPAVLDQGLVAALEWLCASFEKRSGIATTFDALALRSEHSKAVQLTAYRTAQEALTNIAKYAQCSRVKLDLSDAAGALTLEVTDNGCGITAEQLAKPKAYGLKGLNERARTVGGWLDVSTMAGGGTSIILSIPCPEPAQASLAPAALEESAR